jgi:hypothetical protein
MKKLFVLFIFFSAPLMARQYIQCHERANNQRVVINLDGENSTFFITAGVHVPPTRDDIKRLFFVEDSKISRIYRTEQYEGREGLGKGAFQIEISFEYIDKTLQYFEIPSYLYLNDKDILYINNLACFSSVF